MVVVSRNKTLTLIITCLTRTAVVVAADRRLTDLRAGAVMDDDASKLVVVNDRFAVAYTGLANLRPPPRGRTDLWLVDQLPSDPATSLSDLAAVISEQATDAMARITHVGPRSKHHTFVVAGWDLQPPNADYEARVALISNALRADGTPEEWPRKEFSVVVESSLGDMPDAGLCVVPAGRNAYEALNRLGDTISSRRITDPRRIAEMAAETIREVASRDSAVGRGVITASITRDGGVDSLYLPPESNATTVWAPHFVGEHLVTADVQVHNYAMSPEEVRESYERGRREREP